MASMTKFTLNGLARKNNHICCIKTHQLLAAGVFLLFGKIYGAEYIYPWQKVSICVIMSNGYLCRLTAKANE